MLKIARRRRTRRASTRFVARRRSSRRSSGFLGGITPKVVGGALYGAGRTKIAQMISGFIPVGSEMGLSAAMLVASIFVSKQRAPLLKDIGTAGVFIESAALGSMLLTGVTGGSGNGSGEVING